MSRYRPRATRGSEQSRHWTALPVIRMVLDGRHNIERKEEYAIGQVNRGRCLRAPASSCPPLHYSLKQDLLHTPARGWKRGRSIAQTDDKLRKRFSNNLCKPGT